MLLRAKVEWRMALSRDPEGVLSTIEWAHALLEQHKKASGYQMDALMRQKVQLSVSRKPSGLFARYLRGDNVPRLTTQADLMDLDRSCYLSLPLWEILRVGLEGHAFRAGYQRVWAAMDDLQGRFQRRVTRYDGPGQLVVLPEPTRQFAIEVCSYASSHAATVLLVRAMEMQPGKEDHSETARKTKANSPWNALHMGQHAFRCLILAFASGEFPVTAPLTMARVRQRVLDGLCVNGHALDTASVPVEPAVEAARDVLAQARAKSSKSFRQRAYLRSWLKSSDDSLCALTPQITTLAEARDSRVNAPARLKLRSPVSRKGHKRELGIRARTLLLDQLGQYVAESIAVDEIIKPQDGTGGRFTPRAQKTWGGPTAAIGAAVSVPD